MFPLLIIDITFLWLISQVTEVLSPLLNSSYIHPSGKWQYVFMQAHCVHLWLFFKTFAILFSSGVHSMVLVTKSFDYSGNCFTCHSLKSFYLCLSLSPCWSCLCPRPPDQFSERWNVLTTAVQFSLKMLKSKVTHSVSDNVTYWVILDNLKIIRSGQSISI